MEWTLKLEHRDSEGTLHSSTLAKIERPELADEADLGLSHDTGKHLLWLVQMEIASAQVRSFITKARQCSGCGRTRTSRIADAAGSTRFSGRFEYLHLDSSHAVVDSSVIFRL